MKSTAFIIISHECFNTMIIGYYSRDREQDSIFPINWLKHLNQRMIYASIEWHWCMCFQMILLNLKVCSLCALFSSILFISKRDAVSKINLVDSIATISNFQTNSTELITKHTVAELHIKEWYPKRFSDAPTCRRVQSVIQTLYSVLQY